MSYFLGDRPLDTKGKGKSKQVKQAIESDEAPGASEAKKAKEEIVGAIDDSVVYAWARSSGISAPRELTYAERGIAPKATINITRKDSKSTKKLKISTHGAKHKGKTHFPPGLVVSEKAKAKMEERQAKIAKKQEEKAVKRAEQNSRWHGRADVITRWKKWEEKQQEVKDKILAKWDAQDKKRAEKRATRLVKLAEKPEELEKEKKKMAERDVVERLKRAKYIDHVEEKQLKALKKREHAQVRRDKIFNFFGGFLGWKKRAIPEIPQETLEDWGLEGFSDLGEVDTKLSLLVIALVGYAVFAATKTPKPVAAKHKKRK